MKFRSYGADRWRVGYVRLAAQKQRERKQREKAALQGESQIRAGNHDLTVASGRGRDKHLR